MTVAIEVQGLRKRFGKTQALNNLSTDFKASIMRPSRDGPIRGATERPKAAHVTGRERGSNEGDGRLATASMHGVIGPEGAGKTTLFRHLAGLLKPDEGQIRYFLDDQETPFTRIRPCIAYMPQQQSLYADLSIGEHLDFFRELYSLSDAEYKEKRERLLDITRLAPFVDRPAGQLSGGMYKKLGLMCALLSSPSVLLLDEPTNGVDPISRREFWELLYQLEAEQILILIATAYMDEAERCARVHLIDRGCLLSSGEPKSLLEEEGVRNFDEFFLRYSGESPDE